MNVTFEIPEDLQTYVMNRLQTGGLCDYDRICIGFGDARS